MNASLTWWGVAVAVRSHRELSSLVIDQNTLVNVVPVFVALMVWIIRVLIIGTFSMAGDRLFSMAEDRPSMLGSALRARTSAQTARTPDLPRPNRPVLPPVRPVPRPEPSYHPVGMTAKSQDSDHSKRS
jgi:hypothetical protein